VCVCVCMHVFMCVCVTTYVQVLDRLRNWQLFPKYCAACSYPPRRLVQVLAPSVMFRWVPTVLLNTACLLSVSLLLLVFHTVGTDVYCRPTAPSQKTHTEEKEKVATSVRPSAVNLRADLPGWGVFKVV
jgi:hypothetical protein